MLADDSDMLNQTRFFRIRGIHQGFTLDDDYSFAEFSVPMEIYWPLSRENSLYLYTNYAGVSGEYVNDLSGITDTQIFWNYHLEDKNIVLNVGLGLPTGKSTLTADEFETSMLISQHYWNLNVPNFGQGFNLSPGITWARPMSDNVVAGLGMAFQIRSGFIPVEDTEEAYQPGNEFLLTGGLDMRLSPLSTASLDLVFTLYASDKYDNQEIYKSGNKIVTSAQYKRYFDYDILTLDFRFRSKSNNQMLNADGNLVSEDMKTTPNQIDLRGELRHRHNVQFYMTYGIEGRFYEELDVYPGMTLFGVILAPEYSMSKKTRLSGILKYWTGSFSNETSLSGLEAGAGITYLF